MESYYRENLAYIHDTYYGDIARNAAQEILNQSGVFQGKKVTDLGCGSGILASVLSQNGMEVVGVDVSADLLKIAKSRCPDSTFINASLFDYEFDLSDVVCAVGEPFNYLFDERAGYKTVADIIRKIYDRLTSSGLFLFDMLTDEVDPGQNFRLIEKEDLTMFIEIGVESEKTALTRKMTFFIKRNNCYQKDAEIHRQLLFNIDRIEGILSETGFNYGMLSGYNGLAFRKGHYGFLCKK